MLGTICPDTIDATVRSFCEGINPIIQPKYISLRPVQGLAPQECFLNVRDKVASEGGRIVYGWAIWRNPLFIEAEHHAVYAVPGSGELVDITPQEDGGTRMLFLQDDHAQYDFESETARSNIRQPLVKDERVNALCELYGVKHDIENASREGRTVRLQGEMFEMWKGVQKEIIFLELTLCREYIQTPVERDQRTGRNDPCPCNSGKKFKKCCLK